MSPGPDLDRPAIVIPLRPHRAVPRWLHPAVKVGRLAFVDLQVVRLGHKHRRQQVVLVDGGVLLRPQLLPLVPGQEGRKGSHAGVLPVVVDQTAPDNGLIQGKFGEFEQFLGRRKRSVVLWSVLRSPTDEERRVAAERT